MYKLYPLYNLTPVLLLHDPFNPIYWQSLPVFFSKWLGMDVRSVPIPQETRLRILAGGKNVRSASDLHARIDLCAALHLAKTYEVGIAELTKALSECLLSGNPVTLTQFVLRKLASADLSNQTTQNLWDRLRDPSLLNALNEDSLRVATLLKSDGFQPLPTDIRSELSLNKYIPKGLLSSYLTHRLGLGGDLSRPTRIEGRIPEQFYKQALSIFRTAERAEARITGRTPPKLLSRRFDHPKNVYERKYEAPSNPIFLTLPGKGITPATQFTDLRSLRELSRIGVEYRGGFFLAELGFYYLRSNTWINLEFVEDVLRSAAYSSSLS